MEDDGSQNQDSNSSNPIVILLDNNAIQAFLGKDTAPELAEFLKEVDEVGATLAVSDIVLYEALKAVIFDEQKTAEVANFFDNYLTRYNVDEDVLISAARVHEMYGSDKATKGSRHACSTEDIIIATTSMILGAYVLTSDGNDYPMPFFKESNRIAIYYQVKNRRRHKIFYLLQPDQEAISNALAQLDGANIVKTKGEAKSKEPKR
ncbi:MAG: PIN domain-containing protein [Patescibacteria group bacterium]